MIGQPMTYLDTNKAADLLAQRDRAVDELRALITRGIHTDADRSKEDALLSQIAAADNGLRSAVSDAALADAGNLGIRTIDTFQRREVDDARLFGMRLGDVPEMWVARAADTIAEDTHTHEFASVMLSQAPNGSKLLGLVNSFPFTRTRGMVPVSGRVTAQLVARNAVNPSQPYYDVRVATVETVKASAFVLTGRENLEDYPHAETAFERALLNSVGQRVDHVLVNGGTDGDVTVDGFLTAGITTAPATAGTIGLADVLDAVARVEDSGGSAGAVLMSPAGRAAFLAANAQAVGAGILPRIIVLPKLADGTAVLGDVSAVVFDPAQVGVAVRKDVELIKFDKQAALFNADKVALGARARVSGVALADSGHVQVIA
jgi:hypothetical protein